MQTEPTLGTQKAKQPCFKCRSELQTASCRWAVTHNFTLLDAECLKNLLRFYVFIYIFCKDGLFFLNLPFFMDKREALQGRPIKQTVLAACSMLWSIRWTLDSAQG